MSHYRLFVLVLLMGIGTGCAMIAPQPPCTMTAWNMPIDALQDPPFVERAITGDEYKLSGIIRDAATCQPIPDATIMYDLANTQGDYDGTQRGTVHSNSFGLFTIQTNRPGAYGGGIPHVHLFAGKAGYGPITIGHNVVDDVASAWVEIVLDEQDIT